ncbi:MAG TPA: response regulator [Chloroflexota bacterium]|nr:response regulator [Chloroflexota bacterium]
MERQTASTLSILVVEDDEAAADLIRDVLNDVVGWGATVVHDAAAARAVFQHVRIEVLVLDVNLPGISGIELLGLLRLDPHWNEPPIILMSANPGQPSVADALRKGSVTTLLKKPFDVDQLVEEIRSAVAAHEASSRESR